MGFCLFNNISIGARHAQRKHGLMRVAIVDFDVHHGNGTREIFYSDPSVLYASTHQMPLVPRYRCRARNRCRQHLQLAAWRPVTAAPNCAKPLTDRILPALDTFRPELIIVSAGFDAHERDPLGSLQMTADDFAWVTRAIDEVSGDALRRPTGRRSRRRLRPSGPCGFGQRTRRRTDEGLDDHRVQVRAPPSPGVTLRHALASSSTASTSRSSGSV